MVIPVIAVVTTVMSTDLAITLTYAGTLASATPVVSSLWRWVRHREKKAIGHQNDEVVPEEPEDKPPGPPSEDIEPPQAPAEDIGSPTTNVEVNDSLQKSDEEERLEVDSGEPAVQQQQQQPGAAAGDAKRRPYWAEVFANPLSFVAGLDYPQTSAPDPPEAGISYDEYYAGVSRGIYKPPFEYGGRVPTLPRAAGELPRVDVSRLSRADGVRGHLGREPGRPPKGGMSYDEYIAGVWRGLYDPPCACGVPVTTLPRAAGGSNDDVEGSASPPQRSPRVDAAPRSSQGTKGGNGRGTPWSNVGASTHHRGGNLDSGAHDPASSAQGMALEQFAPSGATVVALSAAVLFVWAKIISHRRDTMRQVQSRSRERARAAAQAVAPAPPVGSAFAPSAGTPAPRQHAAPDTSRPSRLPLLLLGSIAEEPGQETAAAAAAAAAAVVGGKAMASSMETPTREAALSLSVAPSPQQPQQAVESSAQEAAVVTAALTLTPSAGGAVVMSCGREGGTSSRQRGGRSPEGRSLEGRTLEGRSPEGKTSQASSSSSSSSSLGGSADASGSSMKQPEGTTTRSSPERWPADLIVPPRSAEQGPADLAVPPPLRRRRVLFQEPADYANEPAAQAARAGGGDGSTEPAGGLGQATWTAWHLGSQEAWTKTFSGWGPADAGGSAGQPEENPSFPEQDVVSPLTGMAFKDHPARATEILRKTEDNTVG